MIINNPKFLSAELIKTAEFITLAKNSECEFLDLINLIQLINNDFFNNEKTKNTINVFLYQKIF